VLALSGMALPDYAATSLAAAQANALAAIQLQVANLNNNLKSNYLTAFNNWLINWNAGRVSDKTTAPLPPNGYIIGFFNDPTTGPGSLGPYGDEVIQWPYPQVGTAAVTDQPPIPAIPPAQGSLGPNHIHVGVSLGSGWWSTGADDTFPPGKTTPPVTSDDGTTGTFEKFGAPVGSGWYFKVG
jgi:hypothetical protein